MVIPLLTHQPPLPFLILDGDVKTQVNISFSGNNTLVDAMERGMYELLHLFLSLMLYLNGIESVKTKRYNTVVPIDSVV